MDNLITPLERMKLEALQAASSYVPYEVIKELQTTEVKKILSRIEAENASDDLAAHAVVVNANGRGYIMYYNASTQLISNNPTNAEKFIRIDRAIARSYSSAGVGWVDDTVLYEITRIASSQINNLLPHYEIAGILTKFVLVECPSNHLFDPAEGDCPQCNTPAALAMPTTNYRYRIQLQPNALVFNPATAKGPFDVFISYRHGEATQLAADLYHALTARGLHVFVDSGIIPPGVSFEKVFLAAASIASHFIFLATSHYFDSTYCQAELAHSLRSGRNVIPVPVGGDLNPPNDMPWLARMNPSQVAGDKHGLTPDLEDLLLPQVQLQPPPVIHDFHLEACAYLLSQLGEGDLTRIISRLTWLNRIGLRGMGIDDIIIAIQREIGNNTTRLQELCAALAP